MITLFYAMALCRYGYVKQHTVPILYLNGLYFFCKINFFSKMFYRPKHNSKILKQFLF